jgi:hypothetical protein
VVNETEANPKGLKSIRNYGLDMGDPWKMLGHLGRTQQNSVSFLKRKSSKDALSLGEEEKKEEKNDIFDTHSRL